MCTRSESSVILPSEVPLPLATSLGLLPDEGKVCRVIEDVWLAVVVLYSARLMEFAELEVPLVW